MFFGALIGGLVAVLGIGYLRQRRAPAAPPPALSVNGQSVSMSDFSNQLQLYAGAQLMQQLVEQKLIEQEASRQKVTLDAHDHEQIDKALKSVHPPELVAAAQHKMESALLAQHLLLQGFSEKERREVYDLYRPQLVQYETSVILLATRKDAHDVARSLEDGVGFDLLAKNYSLDPSKQQGGQVGWLTLPQIRLYMGDQAAALVARLKPHQVGEAVYAPQGLMVIKVGAVRSSYEELKPSIEAILANSKKAELMARLMTQAKISSPYLKEPTSSVLPEAKPKAIVPESSEPLGLPKPNDADVPHSDLAKPSPQTVPALQSLPKPTDGE